MHSSMFVATITMMTANMIQVQGFSVIRLEGRVGDPYSSLYTP